MYIYIYATPFSMDPGFTAVRGWHIYPKLSCWEGGATAWPGTGRAPPGLAAPRRGGGARGLAEGAAPFRSPWGSRSDLVFLGGNRIIHQGFLGGAKWIWPIHSMAVVLDMASSSHFHVPSSLRLEPLAQKLIRAKTDSGIDEGLGDSQPSTLVVKTVLGSRCWLVGEFTTHFSTYFSGDWDVHWGYDLAFDPWPYPFCGVQHPQ